LRVRYNLTRFLTCNSVVALGAKMRSHFARIFCTYQRQNWWRQRGFRFPDAAALTTHQISWRAGAAL